ncbi:MAG: hypothetical protein ACOX2E_03405 [Syntrophaceticus sp.]|jgi:hypothetical protein
MALSERHLDIIDSSDCELFSPEAEEENRLAEQITVIDKKIEMLEKGEELPAETKGI